MVAPDRTEVIRAWKPPIAGVREAFHATFTTHAYPAHTHDVWTVFIVDAGAIRYNLAGRPHSAGQARVGVLPPHVVHDGRAAGADGFRKRVLYLETSLLGEHLIGPAVDRPVVPDGDHVLGRRLEAARDRILRGQSLADVAAEVGFHDQAHLSRHFGRFLGTSPGRYRAAGRPT